MLRRYAGKVLSVYIENIHPQLRVEHQQLLDASHNVWHRLSDDEKIALAAFLDELNAASQSSPPHAGASFCKHVAAQNSGPRSQPMNANSAPLEPPIQKRVSITPFHVYLKDERATFLRKHSRMSPREANKRLSDRWQKMSARTRHKYAHRAYLAKRRLYQKQGMPVHFKKPSFIKRTSSKTARMKQRYPQLANSSRCKHGTVRFSSQ